MIGKSSNIFMELLIFGLCLNSFLFLLQAYGFGPVVFAIGDLSQWQTWFSLGPDAALTLIFSGATAVSIGVAGLLFKNGTYALYAMLIAALCVIIAPVRYFLTAIPNLISVVVTTSITGTGASAAQAAALSSPIMVIIGFLFVVSAFLFIFSKVIGSEV